MIRTKQHFLFVAVTLMLLACDATEPESFSTNDKADRSGFRPVYGSPGHAGITWDIPQTIKNPGKIYIYGKYLLVNERKQGIHVYDNTNAQAPVAIGFVRILGNTDMAIKDGVLYADHMDNVVALTIDNFNSIQEKGRLALSQWNLGLPPPAGFKFECVDPSKGLVIDWKKTDAQNLKCYAIR